jgi:hypothetical protein
MRVNFDANQPTKVVLLQNDFPYHLLEEDDLSHYVLWKLGKEPLTQEDIKTAEFQLQRGGLGETLVYINPPHLKSILDIDHAHIIVRHIDA